MNYTSYLISHDHKTILKWKRTGVVREMSHFSIRGNCLGVPGRSRKRNSDSKQHSPLPLLSVLWTPRGCPWTGLLQAHFEAESVKCISGTLTLNHRTYTEFYGLLGKAGRLFHGHISPETRFVSHLSGWGSNSLFYTGCR